MSETFESVVVQVDMSELHFFLGQRIDIDCKTMILSCDLNLTCRIAQYRVVPSAVPKFELVCLASQRQAKNLMPQANPENRSLPNKPSSRVNRIGDWFRVSRPV